MMLGPSAVPHNFVLALASNCFIIIACGPGNYATIIWLFLLLHFPPSGAILFGHYAMLFSVGVAYPSMNGSILLCAHLIQCTGSFAFDNNVHPSWMLALVQYLYYILLGYWYFCRVKSSLDNDTYAIFIINPPWIMSLMPYS